jgi:TRAP-type mannitol/chloroaromatic compound transport system permease large subunit
MGVPVSVSMILGLIFSVLVFDLYAMISIATLFYSSLDSYLLVAIPLFMLAGIAMSFGGVARRIFDFSESILGFLPGSLGAVNIAASMIFGGNQRNEKPELSAEICYGPYYCFFNHGGNYPPKHSTDYICNHC